MSSRSKADDATMGDLGRSPLANAVFGAIGGGLGAAGVSATLPIILPFLLAGGIVGYMVTNGVPKG